jgi:hypothetical protein
MIRVFGMHVLRVCVKFGCDMGSSLPADENLTFQVLNPTGYGSTETGALPERRNWLLRSVANRA